MYDLAKGIIALRLATRRACMCEGKGQTKKNTLSLKTKVLFLIAEGCSPRDIIACLMIAKTNLALLTRDMATEGLIVKTKIMDWYIYELGNGVRSNDWKEADKIIEAAIMLLDGTALVKTDEE